MPNSDTLAKLKEQASLLPENPGIYQYFDDSGKIIYIGKAKNLKKRVLQYFNREHYDLKTHVLVNKISEIKHIVVNSEEDAFLLENNLIKKYQPKYNLLLKDDKSFPWITIKNELFPRVYKTRRLIKDGSKYFGPYSSGLIVNTLLDLFRQIYPLRTCNLSLTSENIKKKKFKKCLEYHINNCKAPCEGLQSIDEYQRDIDDIQNILKGNTGLVISYLKERMNKLSDAFHFEDADEIKKKLKILDNFQCKSTIVNPSIDNVDVISILNDPKRAYINFLRILNGAIIQVHNLEYVKKLNETENYLLGIAIIELREMFQSAATEIIVPLLPDISMKGVEFTIPKIGDKKKLLELSERNLKYFRLEKLKQQANITKLPPAIRILTNLKVDLNMEKIPIHIECFDNSNIQGKHPVAACVVFKNGKPANKEYRHYNVKNVKGPDDFATMEEIVYRRYKRLLDENLPLPQLIVIDGGKGQLSAAMNSLKKLDLAEQITVIGIAKRLEEIFFPEDPIPLYLDKNSPSLKVIQQIRDEAHRFGINFHRNSRSAAFLKSEIENIPGIGEKTLELLIHTFKSISGIKNASIERLREVIGEAKAKSVAEYFNPTMLC